MTSPAANPCPFCAPPESRLVHASELAMVVRDAFPVSPGHTLVLPRWHEGSFMDLRTDPRGGVRWIFPEPADYWSARGDDGHG